MSPPIAIFNEPATESFAYRKEGSGDVSAMKTKTTGQESQSKLLNEFGNKWDEFKFAPIRESQVSRAMTSRYFKDLHDYGN